MFLVPFDVDLLFQATQLLLLIRLALPTGLSFEKDVQMTIRRRRFPSLKLLPRLA